MRSADDFRDLALRAREMAAQASAMDVARLLHMVADELEEEAFESERTPTEGLHVRVPFSCSDEVAVEPSLPVGECRDAS